jgi:hypothetical protein
LFLCFVYLAATLLFSAPLAFHAADSMFDLGDSEVNVWVMSWPIQFASAGAPPGRNFFDANIFYPVARSLLFNDALLPYQIVFAPAFLLTRNPVLAHNLVFLSCLFFSALAMYRLALYYTGDRAAAFIAGLVFGFAPIHFSQPHHVQFQGLLWMPLCLLFLERWWQHRRYTDMVLSAVCFALQMLTSFYLGSFFAVVLGVWFVLRWWLDGRAARRDEPTSPMVLLAQILVGLLLVAVLVGPYAIGYRIVQQDWSAARTEAENVPLSADLLYSLVGVHPANYLYGKLFQPANWNRAYEQYFFSGFCLLALAALAIRSRFARAEFFHRHTILIHAALAALAFLLALGPHLQVAGRVTSVPLPYKLFADWMPGFGAFRVPARFGLILLLSQSVLAAYGALVLRRWADRAWGRWGRQTFLTMGGATMIGLAFLIGLEFLCAPMQVFRVDAVSPLAPEYRFLRDEHGIDAVLEIPFSSPTRAHKTPEYTLLAALHGRELVNGEGSFFPSTYAELGDLSQRLPAGEALDVLAALEVRTLVVHGDRLPAATREVWMRAAESGKDLRLLAKFENGAMIFRNLRRPRVTDDVKNLNLSLRATELPEGNQWSIEIEAVLPDRQKPVGEAVTVWRHPQLPQRIQGTTIDVMWQADTRGGVMARETKRVVLPLFVDNHAKPFATFLIAPPPPAGTYTLVLRSREFGELRGCPFGIGRREYIQRENGVFGTFFKNVPLSGPTERELR